MMHRRTTAWALIFASALLFSNSTHAGLITFNDRALFESHLASGFSLEDFEDNRAGGPITGFDESLNQFSNNPGFAPGSIEPGLNLFVNGSGSRMVLLQSGFRGLGSDVVGANSFADDLVVQLPDKGFAIGLDYMHVTALNRTLAGRIQVFNQPGILLGTYDIQITNQSKFFGVIATGLPVGALVFRDVDTVGELVDNVTFGDVVPEPASALAFCGIFALTFVRRRNRSAPYST